MIALMENDPLTLPVPLRSPVPIMKVSEQDMQDMQRAGHILAVGRSALLPSAAQNEVFSLTDQGAPLPVYVLPRMGQGNTDAPEAKIVELADGKRAIFMNEGYHKWTEDYVRSRIMLSDEETKKFQSPQDYLDGLKKDAANKTKFTEVIETPGLQLIDAAKEAAKKAGIDNLQVVIGKDTQHAGVLTNREGTHYLMINPSVFILHAIKPDSRAEFLGLVGHEFAHIKNGDTLPAKIITARDPAVQRRMELEADLTAPAVTGNNNQYLKTVLSGYIPEYNKENAASPVAVGSSTLPDIKKVSDWLVKTSPKHPSLIERIASMEIQGALLHGLESNATRHGRPLSDKDRQDNAAWAVQQVLRQFDERTLPDPASMKPLPDHVRQQVQGIGKLPMSEADKAQKPAAPVAPVVEGNSPNR